MWTNSVDGTHGWDFVDGDSNPMDIDPSGTYHGTGVAGVIAAITDNGQGIAGTAQISVIALRALGSNGQGSSLNTSQAIGWAADQGAKVITLSLGTNETFVGPTDIQLAVNYAWSKGALIVAAAGNSGTSTLDYPARLANVVSVAAIDESGTRASFSNYGSGLDLSAPGTRIVTLSGGNNQPNNVHYLQGTSFSTPFVTGAAALILSVDPTLTNVELWNILNSTAVQPAGAQRPYNPNYGWGVVNVWNAINALSQPFISVNSYPSSVSSSSTFGVTWSILGPTGVAVTDTHVLWGTVSGSLGNASAVQSGRTHDSFTANGFSMPSGAGAMYFKVVATVNGTTYTSREYTVTASSLPDFLFVLYQLLASNLLYLALFILVLAGVVAFIPQRRAARARRAAARPLTLYPPSYYVQAARPSQPPPVPQPTQVAPWIEPQMAGPPAAPTQIAPAAQPPHMNRHRTAARADVIDAGRAGLRRERPHNLAGEDEGLGLVREFFRRSEIGDPRRRAVRGRLTCDEPGHRMAHFPREGEEQQGISETIHPDDVCAGVSQRAGALGRRMPVIGLRILVERHRDHGRHPRLLDPLHGEEGFSEPGERLRDHEVWVFLELGLQLLVE